jgi:hypothetical protein
MERRRPQPDNKFLTPQEKGTLRQLQSYMRNVPIPTDQQGDQRVIEKVRAIPDQVLDEAMKQSLPKRNEPPTQK